jgi:hypothetical protein
MKNSMIIIFSSGDDISTRDVKNRLTNMSQDVVVIEPIAAQECFSVISNDAIIFESSDGKRYNLLDATACWWRRTGIGMKNLVNEVPKKNCSRWTRHIKDSQWIEKSFK